MISGEAHRLRIDDTLASVALRMPKSLRGQTSRLAYRLGLTPAPEQGFEAFVVMAPNRDLPRYAAEATGEPGVCRLPQSSLDQWRRAHHCAAVYGLISDRLDDGQVKKATVLVKLREAMLAAWKRELGHALGSPSRARALVNDALLALARGNAMEREALSVTQAEGPGTLSARVYVETVRAKLRWFGVAGRGVLLSFNEPERARALEDAYDTFSVGLQCLDDALDAEKDERLRGASFPAALGLPGGALLTASKVLFARSAELAARGSFHELSEWLSAMASRAGRAVVPGDALKNALGASVLIAAAKEVIP